MSDAQTEATPGAKIGEESARAQVKVLFEAFEADVEEGERSQSVSKLLVKAVTRGRLEINGEGDGVKITQHFRKQVEGKSSVDWNWSRLGLGRSRVKVTDTGIGTFGTYYSVAAPMTGIAEDSILKMHPVDLSVLEDIAAFFQLL